MFRIFSYLPGFLLLLLLGGSARQFTPLTEVPFAKILIAVSLIKNAQVNTRPPLKFLQAWQLSSSDKNFGGISSLIHDGSAFMALTDAGALITFQFRDKGRSMTARIAPLPIECAPDRLKTSVDSESITRISKSGALLIGFEWRNAICRIDRTPHTTAHAMKPPAMRNWPLTGGAESMTSLRDGRVIVIAERPADGRDVSPMLIFDRDPTDPQSEAHIMGYQPPQGFRPSDMVELPDGQIMIINRRFQFPFDFLSVLTIIDRAAIRPGTVVSGREIARLQSSGIADNFEAIAVSQNKGRTYIWLMSDDNFSRFQSTYLLLFELKAKPN
jgi:hypothetical protein